MAMTDGHGDAVLTSLAGLVSTLEEVASLADQVAAKAELIREWRRSGHTYRDIAYAEEPPRVVELVSRMIDLLTYAGGQYRRAQARALHDEGATMEQVADLFGVTRQRVSALLRHAAQA